MADGSLVESASEPTTISRRLTLEFILSRLRLLSVQQTFAALKYPNYRLWFWGQMVSLNRSVQPAKQQLYRNCSLCLTQQVTRIGLANQ
jgi:hypothetical protein